MKIIVHFAGQNAELCSGVVIGKQWVLTAGHCFLGGKATADVKGMANADYAWNASAPDTRFADVTVEASNAVMLEPADRLRRGVVAIVYSQYKGAPDYNSDLALIKLESAYPDRVIEPAALTQSFQPAATIAGFGFTNAKGGLLGQFELSWPVELLRQSENGLNFSPADGGAIKSGFCQGDSGGPVFAGRVRGCKANEADHEVRPRRIQGVISTNRLGTPTEFGSQEIEASSSCRNAASMDMQDITKAGPHAWICRVTGNEAGGCG
jgi:V8-like Glu-specific endopeptidase